MGARNLTYKGEKLPYPHYRQKICALFELSAQEMGLYTEALEETNETAPILSTPWQEIPAQKQDSHTDKQLFHPRRRFLMGLGGNWGNYTFTWRGLDAYTSRLIYILYIIYSL